MARCMLSVDNMHRAIVICVLMTTATGALPMSPVDIAWSKAADNTGNSVLYFVETKQELLVFREVPAPIPISRTTTDTSAPSSSSRTPAPSTRAPATNTSAPSTSFRAIAPSTRVPATNTSAPSESSRTPALSTRALATNTSAPSTSFRVIAPSTRAPATNTSAPSESSRTPALSTRAPATNTSALTTGTSALTTTSNTLLPSSMIPPGYTFKAATGSFYKFHNESAVSWHEANATCTSEGAHLVVLNNAEEADIVRDIVSDAVGDFHMYLYGTWTGLRDKRPGGVMEWRTVHGEPLSEVFNRWGDDEPEDDEELTCAFFCTLHTPHNRLHDYPCHTRHYFTCERSE